MSGRSEEKTDMYEETTEKLLEFISSSPTAFHAAETIRKRFLEEGFTELKEEEHWELEKGGKYFFHSFE